MRQLVVVETDGGGPMGAARGGVGDGIEAAHLGTVGEPDVVATLRVRRGHARMRPVDEQLHRAAALACGGDGALLDAEAQRPEASFGARREVEEVGGGGDSRIETGRDRREFRGERHECLAHRHILAEGRA